jgi:pimeloyl-ACP methyl ester carboxylesterase
LLAQPWFVPDPALAVTIETMLKRLFALFTFTWLALLGGCARMPGTGVTTLQPETLDKLRGHLLSHKADLDQFRLRGPFAVTVQSDHDVHLSKDEVIEADLYLSAPAEKAPLVIFLHGQDNSKDDHAYQAFHLATWGMHSMCLQLPNNGPWTKNGENLARIVHHIRRRPESIDSRIDPNRILLVGHSFGGSSVAIALATGAPAVGAILLDPAGIGRALPDHLKKVRTPVMVLASDGNISETRNRGYFYEYIRSEVAEVSITGAQHDDAQFPREPTLLGIGSDSSATEERQITFVSALTSAAFSLGFTGKLDYAWTSFGDAIRTGKLFDALRK